METQKKKKRAKRKRANPVSGFHQFKQDSPERINRCLTCPYPPELCLGERKCLAQHRTEREADRKTAAYAVIRKGMKAEEVAELMGVSKAFVQQMVAKEIFHR